VAEDHALRAVRAITDEILEAMSPLFDALYAECGQPSIPPDKLLRPQLLQTLYSVRSERLLIKGIDYGILYRRFVGLNLHEKVWGCDDIYKEPRPIAGGDGGDGDSGADGGAGAASGSGLRRALYGGRHAAGSLGEPEELSAQ